jgi:hypothetical protein
MFNIHLPYIYLVYLTYFFSILIFFGIFTETVYLSVILDCVRLFVSLFIIIRFNPYRKTEFNNLDKKIAFHSGLLLFSITTLDSIIENLPFIGSDLQNRLKLISSSRS